MQEADLHVGGEHFVSRLPEALGHRFVEKGGEDPSVDDAGVALVAGAGDPLGGPGRGIDLLEPDVKPGWVIRAADKAATIVDQPEGPTLAGGHEGLLALQHRCNGGPAKGGGGGGRKSFEQMDVGILQASIEKLQAWHGQIRNGWIAGQERDRAEVVQPRFDQVGKPVTQVRGNRPIVDREGFPECQHGLQEGFEPDGWAFPERSEGLRLKGNEGDILQVGIGCAESPHFPDPGLPIQVGFTDADQKAQVVGDPGLVGTFDGGPPGLGCPARGAGMGFSGAAQGSGHNVDLEGCSGTGQLLGVESTEIPSGQNGKKPKIPGGGDCLLEIVPERGEARLVQPDLDRWVILGGVSGQEENLDRSCRGSFLNLELEVNEGDDPLAGGPEPAVGAGLPAGPGERDGRTKDEGNGAGGFHGE